MKGLPTSSRCSIRINSKAVSIIYQICLFCSFTKPTRSTEYPTESKEPFKHVPTHAKSDLLKNTTPPTMQPATESVADDISVGDLDPDLAMAIYDEGLAEIATGDGCVTDGVDRAGSAEDGHLSEVASSGELHPQMGALEKIAQDMAVATEHDMEEAGTEAPHGTGGAEIDPSSESLRNIDSTPVDAPDSLHALSLGSDSPNETSSNQITEMGHLKAGCLNLNPITKAVNKRTEAEEE